MDRVLALAQCLWGVASPRAVSSLSGVPSWWRVCFAPWGVLWVGGGLGGRGVTGAGTLPLLAEARSTTHSVPHKGLSCPQYLRHSEVCAHRAVGDRGEQLGVRLENQLDTRSSKLSYCHKELVWPPRTMSNHRKDSITCINLSPRCTGY